jgi:hypothetical protein
MDKISNTEGWEIIKRKRWRPKKIKSDELLTTLTAKEAPIPDWKKFNIRDITNLNTLIWDIELKDIKVNNKGERYIDIKWRKYFEHVWQPTDKESLFMKKWKTLFIWDKIEGLAYRTWISIQCTSFEWENLHLEERKSRYNPYDRSLHLWELLSSQTHSASEIITTILRNWKIVRITKDMITRYFAWKASNVEVDCIKYAMRKEPWFLAYMQNFDS